MRSRLPIAALVLPPSLWQVRLAWASGDGQVHQSLEAWFPDYDCIRGGAAGLPQVVDWAAWLAVLDEPGRQDSWMDRSIEQLVVLSVEPLRAQAAQECPVGLLLADLLQALYSYELMMSAGASGGELEERYQRFEALVREGLDSIGLRVLIGSRWPIFSVLSSEVWGSAAAATGAEPDHGPPGCCRSLPHTPVLDWERFRHVFHSEDWYQPAVDVAYGPELEEHWREAAFECPLGFATANLIKLMLCAHTESVCFSSHAMLVTNVLVDSPLHLVSGSGWPIFQLLAHIQRAVRRHSFHLDFWPHELLPSAPGQELAASVAPSASMQSLQAVLPALHAAVAAAEGSCAEHGSCGHGLRLVYATMAFGPRFNAYIGRFLARARTLGITSMAVFCLDEGARQECEAAGGHCISGTPSILNKFTLPLALLEAGFDVLWLDLDVFLFKSPAPIIEQQVEAGSYELLVSGSFAVDCVCSGVVFFRAAPRTKSWLGHLLSWMYQHPYEHDQKAFSAFLRAGERVAFEWELPVKMEELPRWAFLDPETQFVSARHVDVAGWAGDADDIVAFHLLHGDSDFAEASRQFAQLHDLGVGYMPLMDIFFNQTDLPELYTTPVLPHHISPVLREALWRSRRPEARRPPPESRGRCNETVPMRY